MACKKATTIKQGCRKQLFLTKLVFRDEWIDKISKHGLLSLMVPCWKKNPNLFDPSCSERTRCHFSATRMSQQQAPVSNLWSCETLACGMERVLDYAFDEEARLLKELEAIVADVKWNNARAFALGHVFNCGIETSSLSQYTIWIKTMFDISHLPPEKPWRCMCVCRRSMWHLGGQVMTHKEVIASLGPQTWVEIK